MISEVQFSQQDFDLFSKFKELEFPAHKKAVNSVEWNGLGVRLASVSENSLKIWNYDDIVGLTKLSEPKLGHDGVIESVKWGDQTTLLTVSKEAFKIWDIRENKAVRSERNQKKLKPDFTRGEWHPNGNAFAVGTKQNVINFYDKRNPGLVDSIKHTAEIEQFGWDKSASVFIITVWESTGCLELREAIPGYPVADKISCHPAKITCFQVDPSNKYVATGGEDAVVTLYDLQEMLCLQTLHKTDGGIKNLSFSPNSKYLAVANEESYFDIYNIETGRHSYRRGTGNDSCFNCIRWHPKRDVMAFTESEEKGRKGDEGKILLLVKRPERSGE